MQQYVSRPHPSGLAVEVGLPDDAVVRLVVQGDGRVIDLTFMTADLALDGVGLVLDGARDPAALDPETAVQIAAVELVGADVLQARLTAPDPLPVELCDFLGIDADGTISWPRLSSLISLCVAVMLSDALRS